MPPEEALKVKPIGSAGEMVNPMIAPPLEVMEVGFIALPTEMLCIEGRIAKTGGRGLTAKVKVTELESPTALSALRVKLVLPIIFVGVPAINPLAPSKVNPAGSDGEILKLEIAPPLEATDIGVIALPITML